MREVKLSHKQRQLAWDAFVNAGGHNGLIAKGFDAAAPYLQEELVVTDEDVQAYCSNAGPTLENCPVIAEALQRVFDLRNALNALNAPKTAKDRLEKQIDNLLQRRAGAAYGLLSIELNRELIAIAEAYAQEVQK